MPRPEPSPAAMTSWMIIFILLLATCAFILTAHFAHNGLAIRAQRAGTICFAIATAMVIFRALLRTISRHS